jgi:RNA polymerase sporulation-specific sigma factor
MRIRDGEEKVNEVIMDRYKNLVRKKAGSMYLLGADREDLIQEGMIGLFKAIRDYDIGRDASFSTFAELCVSRQMYSAPPATKYPSEHTHQASSLLSSTARHSN